VQSFEEAGMSIASLYRALAVLALTLCSGLGQAQAPSTARIMIGFPPGGAMDIVARLVVADLAEALGRPFIAETRAGAGGQVAAVALKNAAPDGNTLLIVVDAHLVLAPHTFKKLPYDPLNDFAPIAHAGKYELGLVVGANSPVKHFREWASWVKADLKNATYGTTNAGSALHFLGLMIAQATGVSQVLHVPYQGSGPMFIDLSGGRLPSAVFTLGPAVAYAKGGKVRVLAQAGERRTPSAPDVPTFKELGYPDVMASGWLAIMAPAGIRPELQHRLNQILIQAMRTPRVRDRMLAIDLEIIEMSPADMTALIRKDYQRWAPVVKASGFTADSQ
jgi:tripartite-type tricarboxylate transporter receptor subunit TctC